MELIDFLESNLTIIARLIEIVLEFIAIFCVLLGLFKAFQQVHHDRRIHQKRSSSPYLKLRLRFGFCLALALEFQLGADIVSTAVSPNFRSLGQLGIIALIRTFLNFFLNKELAAEYEMQKQASREEPDLEI